VNPQAGADPVVAWFRTRYGGDPAGIWHAPGRANLIGEHTDYNDGFVLPFALDRGVLAAAAPGQDGVLELTSRQAGPDVTTVPLAGLAPGAVTGWAAYPAGVAWALARAGFGVPGVRLAIDSDLPQGAGLSSSAALECAVALALTQLAGVDVTRPELAAIARRAENDFVGVPSGIMDQSAALLCQAGHALLLDCRSGESDSVPLNPAGSGLALVIIDTRARHALTDSGYAARHVECAEAARALGVATLREIADPAAVDQLTDPVLRRRARHVITENERVLAVAARLRRGDVAGCGQLLNDSHASLRDDFEISWPQADVAVDAAVAAGALGARMMGGGFGGSVIALVPADGGGPGRWPASGLIPSAARWGGRGAGGVAEPGAVGAAGPGAGGMSAGGPGAGGPEPRAGADSAEAIRAAVRGAFAQRGWPEPEFLDAPPSASAQRVW
jgi:galactokinase